MGGLKKYEHFKSFMGIQKKRLWIQAQNAAIAKLIATTRAKKIASKVLTDEARMMMANAMKLSYEKEKGMILPREYWSHNVQYYVFIWTMCVYDRFGTLMDAGTA